MGLINSALDHQINLAGNVLRVRYYTETIGSVWDDERTITKSGNDLYISGTIHKIDAMRGSEDQVLLEQGRIAYNDTKFFINGSVQTTSGIRIFTIGISGIDQVFREITPGAIIPQFAGTNVYKKIYGRLIPNGSLF